MHVHKRLKPIVLLSIAVLVAACGVPTTGESNTEKGGDSTPTNPFQQVYSKLAGLNGQERRNRLVELAQDERPLLVYTSNTDLQDMAQTFSDKYNLQVDVFRSRSNQILQRILEEARAGELHAGLVDNNALEMAVLNKEGLLADYRGPATKGLSEWSNQDGWVASRLTEVSVAWNDDLVRKDEVPKTYEDLADDTYAGRVIVEPRAYDWYMTLSKYFEKQGTDPDEFEKTFRKIVRNARLVEGNTNQVQFLASGEAAISAGTYNHLIDDAIDDGAPIKRLPAVEPVVGRPNGVGLLRSARSPASALLLFEWLLTDAQPIYASDNRLSARPETQGDLMKGIDELAIIDVETLLREGKQWEKRYQRILQEAKGTVQTND